MCSHCGYVRRPNYWLNLVAFGVIIIPAAMATCSVVAVATSLHLPNTPESQGAGIVAGFSLMVGPVALALLLGLINWQFALCYRSQSTMKSLMPFFLIIGAASLASAGGWLWSAFSLREISVPAVIGGLLSLAIFADMLWYIVKDRRRRARYIEPPAR